MLPNDQTILKTSADDLFDLVKKNEKISVEEAAKILKIPQKTVQALVDFLVEEKIFGLEYKFTTPYIFLSEKGLEKKPQKISVKSSIISTLISKEDFYKKSKQKGIPHERIEGLWKKYLNHNILHIKDEFYRKARLRNISAKNIGSIWKKYLTYLL